MTGLTDAQLEAAASAAERMPSDLAFHSFWIERKRGQTPVAHG